MGFLHSLPMNEFGLTMLLHAHSYFVEVIKHGYGSSGVTVHILRFYHHYFLFFTFYSFSGSLKPIFTYKSAITHLINLN